MSKGTEYYSDGRTAYEALQNDKPAYRRKVLNQLEAKARQARISADAQRKAGNQVDADFHTIRAGALEDAITIARAA